VRLGPGALGKVKSGWWRYARIVEESEPDGDGWATCTIRTDGLEVARDVVLGLGSEAEIVDPPELQGAVQAAARAALGGNRGNDS
jgi:predicted DNA-binding transcriptional regulator YafY